MDARISSLIRAIRAVEDNNQAECNSLINALYAERVRIGVCSCCGEPTTARQCKLCRDTVQQILASRYDIVGTRDWSSLSPEENARFTGVLIRWSYVGYRAAADFGFPDPRAF